MTQYVVGLGQEGGREDVISGSSASQDVLLPSRPTPPLIIVVTRRLACCVGRWRDRRPSRLPVETRMKNTRRGHGAVKYRIIFRSK